MAVNNSTTNFFSPQDNFFIIDSENLSNVTPKFYGFSVQASGIYDRHNITQEALAGLDGTGTYVSVEQSGNEIIIRQDFIGCYGLYMYRDGSRFVISNSFLYLMEYMSRRTRLTMNRDYANHYLMMGFCSMAYPETFINEIELLPHDVVVRIDISSRTLSTERINYGENTVRLNSAEGMKILDEWIAKWRGVIRNMCAHTTNIMADLSGGFDSRMVFGLLLTSGADMNKICVDTIKAKGYTFSEDYLVSTVIAKHFGFELDNMSNFTGGELNYSLYDCVNTAFYMRAFVHNQFLRCARRFEDKRIRLTGNQGEVIRPWTYWHPAEREFILENKGGVRSFSEKLKKEMGDSTELILKRLIDVISSRLEMPITDELAPYVIRETYGRSHHGTYEAMFATGNMYMLAPLADALLNRLKLNDENCADKNLLMYTIYTRCCPELLKLPFIKGRVINYETLRFAEKICATFPQAEVPASCADFSFVPRDPEVSALLEHNNPPLEADAHTEFLKKTYASTKTRKLFATCFDEEIYFFAENYAKRSLHHPLAKCNTVIGATEVIKHLIISEGTQERSIAEDLREFADSELVSTIDRKMNKVFSRNLLFRRIASIPERIRQKIMRIIRRK